MASSSKLSLLIKEANDVHIAIKQEIEKNPQIVKDLTAQEKKVIAENCGLLLTCGTYTETQH